MSGALPDIWVLEWLTHGCVWMVDCDEGYFPTLEQAEKRVQEIEKRLRHRCCPRRLYFVGWDKALLRWLG